MENDTQLIQLSHGSGGLAGASGMGMLVNEDSIKVIPGVTGACQLLGLDPLYIANEGILVAFVDGNDAEMLVEEMRKTEAGKEAAIIGEVVETPVNTVLLKTNLDGIRILHACRRKAASDMLKIDGGQKRGHEATKIRHRGHRGKEF